MVERKVCPLCGRPLDGNWRGREGQVFAAGTAIPKLEAGMAWERRAPTRSATVDGDVVVPLLQSGVTALVGGGLGLVAGRAIAGGEGAVGGFVVGSFGTFGVMWSVLLQQHRKALWAVERITGLDLDGDGHKGRPDRSKSDNKPDPPVILRAPRARVVPESDEVFETVTTEDLGANRRLAQDLAEFVTRGARVIGFGIRDWTGQVLSSGTEVSDPKWREFTGWLRDAELLESGPAGTRLTVGLDEALRSILVGRR